MTLDHNEAVTYRCHWSAVVDDDGHTLVRGERTAVCRKTFRIYSSAPYAADVLPVPPLAEVAGADAPRFDGRLDHVRGSAETKRGVRRDDVAPGTGHCGPTDGAGCC